MADELQIVDDFVLLIEWCQRITLRCEARRRNRKQIALLMHPRTNQLPVPELSGPPEG